jgi:hypothetical protein
LARKGLQWLVGGQQGACSASDPRKDAAALIIPGGNPVVSKAARWLG